MGAHKDYLGHRPGGDPVQRHSAGEFYPFVIAVDENPIGGRWYTVLGPRLRSGWRFHAAEDAERCARGWKRAHDSRPRPIQTLGEYIARYAPALSDSDGGEQ